jgi:hypothetical protein
LVNVRSEYHYGTDQIWGILSDDDPCGCFTAWFRPSKARRGNTARKNDAKKGYYIGYVVAPAVVKVAGSGTGLAGALTCRPVAVRTDDGFSRDVEIIDNGHGERDLQGWYNATDGM